MKELLGRWKHLRHRYAALTRRERIFLALAIVFGPLLIGNALFVDPQFTRGAAAERSLTSQNGSLATMQAQLRSLQQELSVDPDAGKKAELAALGEQREKLDAQLKQLGNELVRPEEMNGLLEHLLARQTGLRLISLKTLAPQSIMADKEAGVRSEGNRPQSSLSSSWAASRRPSTTAFSTTVISASNVSTDAAAKAPELS